MTNNLSKKQRSSMLRKLNGWFIRDANLLYGAVGNDLKSFKSTFVLQLKHIDPDKIFALYKGLHIKTSSVVNDLTSVGATTATLDLKTAVAHFNSNGELCLKVVSIDDKNTWNLVGKPDANGHVTSLMGSIDEFGLKSTNNDKVFGGGLAGFCKLTKRNNPPNDYLNYNVEAEYNKQYNKVYPPS